MIATGGASLLVVAPACCVAACARVRTPRGEVAAGSLVVGDRVESVEIATGRPVTGTIVRIRRARRECIGLRWHGGTLVCTPDHPLYSPEWAAYRPASDWLTGDARLLLARSGEVTEVVAVESGEAFAGMHDVIDLTLADEPRNFSAAGIIVHNKSDYGPGELSGYTTTNPVVTLPDTTGNTPTDGSDEEPCIPDMSRPCYDGPAGSDGVGVCAAGLETCELDGDGWGPCDGQVLPGIEDCTTPSDEDCDGQTFACPASMPCARRFGDAEGQLATAADVDAAGNLAMAGYFAGKMDLGGGPLTAAGPQDVFVAKFDPTCVHLWSRSFHINDHGSAVALATDGSGAVVVTGYYRGTVDFGDGMTDGAGAYLVRLDTDGGLAWHKEGGTLLGDDGLGVDVSPGGRVAYTGKATAPDFGDGVLQGPGVAVVFDGDGNHVWSRGWANGAGAGITFDPGEGVIVAGGLFGTADFGGGDLTNEDSGEDLYVASFDATGAHRWSRRFSGGVGNIRARVDADGMALVAGIFSGQLELGGLLETSDPMIDIFVAKLDEDGVLVYGKQYGGPGIAQLEGLAVSPESEVILTGSFTNPIDFGTGPLESAGLNDVFVARLDADGAATWSARYGDAEGQRAFAVAVDSANNIVIVGYAAGTVDFGTGPLVGTGDAYDAFLAKLGP